jgi:hypothetical protein
MINKYETKNIKDKCRSKYLTSQHELLTLLCLMNLFIKIRFLFNQIIIEIDIYKIN